MNWRRVAQPSLRTIFGPEHRRAGSNDHEPKERTNAASGIEMAHRAINRRQSFSQTPTPSFET